MGIKSSYLDNFGQKEPETKSLTDIIRLISGGHYQGLIEQIREAKESGNDEDSRNLKNSLPMFFPTVEIFNKNSLAEDSVPTGIVQFDIDVKDNLDLDFDQLKQAVCKIPEVIYAFESPSGGLKFGVLTDFKKNDSDDLLVLKKRFNKAYELTLAYVQKFVEIEDDEHMANLKWSCFLSSDKYAYHNPDCKILIINDQCLYTPPKMVVVNGQDVSVEQVSEWLGYIPPDFEWGERRAINYSVFSCLGQAGIPLLFNHWTTGDREKLTKDLESQCKSREYGSVGYLINVAKQHGYKPVTGRARNKLMPKVSEFEFPPLVSHDQGMGQLNQHMQEFFDTGKSKFINVSAGAGKTNAYVQFLKNLPKRNDWSRYNKKRILLLVPTHKLAEEIKEKLGTHVNHLQGKYAACERKKNLEPYRIAKISAPIEQCMEGCHLFETCAYIRQFDDVLTSIRIMTHSELINSPSAWLYGSVKGHPRQGGWKPDYIIVDEDWLTKEEYTESYSNSDYDSIRNIIHICGTGVSLEDAVLANIPQLLKDNVTMVEGKLKRPVYKNTKQYIADSKSATGDQQSEILKRLSEFALTGDVDCIRPIRYVNKRLRATIIKPIAERYKDTPTLFLDATADEAVVKELLDVDFHSVAIKPNDDVSLYQLQGKIVLKPELETSEFRNQLIEGLKNLSSKYQRVGLISYKTVDGVPGNFSGWLARQCGIEVFGHFGNIRGVDCFKDVDCLIVVGRYRIPDYELESYSYGVFGKSSNDKEYVDVPVRMKGGCTMTMNNRPFVDSEMRRIKKHFSDSETIQAIGRARLIHGGKKDIYLFSHESLGADVEVADFFELGDLIDSPEVTMFKEIGFCLDMPKHLHDLGYSKNQVKTNRVQIDTELTKAGIGKFEVTVKDHNRNTRSKSYYVHDMNKLNQFILDSGAEIVD